MSPHTCDRRWRWRGLRQYAKYYFGLNGLKSDALSHEAVQLLLQTNPASLIRRVDPEQRIKLVQQRSREYESRCSPRHSPEARRLLAAISRARPPPGGVRVQRSLSI